MSQEHSEIQIYTPEQAMSVRRQAHLADRERMIKAFESREPNYTHMWRENTELWDGRVMFSRDQVNRMLEEGKLRTTLDLIDSQDPVESQAFEEDWEALIKGEVKPFKGPDAVDICGDDGYRMKPRFKDEARGIAYWRCICGKVRWPNEL